jgi:hypothetical protein
MASPASLAPPRADGTGSGSTFVERASTAGLTHADLLDRARLSADWRYFPDALGFVLRDEVEWGRVTLDDGVYRLVPDAFDAATVAALRALAL